MLLLHCVHSTNHGDIFCYRVTEFMFSIVVESVLLLFDFQSIIIWKDRLFHVIIYLMIVQ